MLSDETAAMVAESAVRQKASRYFSGSLFAGWRLPEKEGRSVSVATEICAYFPLRTAHVSGGSQPAAAYLPTGNNLPKNRAARSFLSYPQKLWKTLWKTLWEAPDCLINQASA